MKLIITILTILFNLHANSTEISGVITDINNNPISYSSILVKGTNKGTTSNLKGEFNIHLTEGNYTLVCQHIGYKTLDKKIKLGKEAIKLNFQLVEQQYDLKEVIIKKNGEDPAYEIIRNAIKLREEHLNEIKKFECEVYVKGQIQLRNYPKKFMGEKVDFEDGDTSKRKIIFLSESVANYYVDGKEKRKIEVVSTKVSGNSDGFGLGSPQLISFYENIINVGRGLNPRGFVSPISNNALQFYKYKYEGSFVENNQIINRIKVIPKRTYEPLFTGYINIIEDEWRIHSTDLNLLKEQQLQFLDTLNIQQIYVPINNHWVIKQQVIYPAGKIFNFDFFGNIVQVYNKFNSNPSFAKGFFDNTVLKYYDSSNKKSAIYWDSVRPLPLLDSEVKDYKRKDSLEQVRKDPKYLDSIDRKNNKINIAKLFLYGQSFNNEKNKSNFSIDPLLTSLLQFNTVEGLVSNFNLNYTKNYTRRKTLNITSNFRYGFSNQHFNTSINTRYTYGKKYLNIIRLNFGSNIFQFNNNNPISFFNNTLSTLLWTNNFMKIYEAKFLRIDYAKGLGKGFTINSNINYQDRIPLENTTAYNWRKIEGREFTPNFPNKLITTNITEHKALSITTEIIWSPGGRYVEFPDRKISIGSKYPTLRFSYTKGINNLFDSEADYDKWHFGISDNLNLKLAGRLNYNFTASGFTNTNKVFVPDMNHLLSNQISVSASYLNTFQLMPYYTFSNTSNLFFTSHIQYHLNGLLTNKIPVFKKLNWFFVIGGNALYNNDTQEGYYEAMFSIENILKVLRVDFIKSFETSNTDANFRINFSTPLFNNR